MKRRNSQRAKPAEIDAVRVIERVLGTGRAVARRLAAQLSAEQQAEIVELYGRQGANADAISAVIYRPPAEQPTDADE